jgi:hypothetical protein
MEFWLGLGSMIPAESEYEKEMVPDVCEQFWDEMLFHKKHKNIQWERISWLLDSNIHFTIRYYRMFNLDDEYDDGAENKAHYQEFLTEVFRLPCSFTEFIAWFINIPNKDDYLLYVLRWGNI